jgi:hypothetical protein
MHEKMPRYAIRHQTFYALSHAFTRSRYEQIRDIRHASAAAPRRRRFSRFFSSLRFLFMFFRDMPPCCFFFRLLIPPRFIISPRSAPFRLLLFFALSSLPSLSTERCLKMHCSARFFSQSPSPLQRSHMSHDAAFAFAR